MKGNMFQSYQAGQAGSVLPPGYMAAATEPGRALGHGIQSGLQSLAAGIQQRNLLQRQDAKDAKVEAKAAEQEAKQLAKERAANEGVIRAYKPDVDPRELALMGANDVESLARMVQLNHQLDRDQQQSDYQQAQIDATKLAGQINQQEANRATQRDEGMAAYLAGQVLPATVRNPNLAADIASDYPAAAADLMKMLPKPDEYPEFFSDPETGARFMSRGNTTMPSNAPKTEPEVKQEALVLKSEGGKTFMQRGGKWYPVTDTNQMLKLLGAFGGGGMAAGQSGDGNDPLGIR